MAVEIETVDGEMVKTLMRDLIDRRVRLKQAISNHYVTLAAGTACTVTGLWRNSHLNLRSDKCYECGVRIHISRVNRNSVQLVPK